MTYARDKDDIIREIDSLFYDEHVKYEIAEDEVIITIKAKRSQVVIEHYQEPTLEDYPGLPLTTPQWSRHYYRINLRNPEAPPGQSIIELKFPKQFTYYCLGTEPHITYYKQTEGRNRMQFFLPETGSWRESTYLDAEDYANRGGHGRMNEVSFTDLPDSIQTLEGDCE
jgi:hypothetical protein